MEYSMQSLTEPTLLIDGDLYLYKAAAACFEEIEWAEDQWTTITNLNKAKDIITSNFTNWVDKFDAKKIIVCLTGSHNFRKQLSDTYKSNRKSKRKPEGFASFTGWAMNTFSYYKHPALEADDGLGIIATMPGNENTIIVSDDKDMLTIPAKVYRPSQDLLVDITSDEADKNFYMQTLAGDAVDGYPGIPGVGAKKAEAILGARPAWSSVEQAYLKHGLSKEDAILNARLARILRWSDWDAQNKSVKLWTPTNG